MEVESNSLTDQVAQVLADEIRTGALALGARLPTEQLLTERFRVSRTVIREALSRLKSDAMVETRQGLGAFVCLNATIKPFKIGLNARAPLADVVAILELRLGVEAEAAALAAERGSEEDLSRIARSFQKLSDTIRRENEATHDDYQFHSAIVNATGNDHYISFIKFISQHIHQGMSASRENSSRLGYQGDDLISEHRIIVDAIEARDPERARWAARTHVQNGIWRLKGLKKRK